uniref:Uncharacterized protein n=1 Tax=Anopheles christyi TaxID=43041 RepID=A0A182KBK3_9DIPT
MRITHHPGRAIDASLSLEQRSAMGALYEANWNKVQSSMNSLIASHHETHPYETVGQAAVRPSNHGPPSSYRTSIATGSSEDDEGLPDEEEVEEESRDAFQESSGVLKALNGYRPATIRRARQRQYPEWDELKDAKEPPDEPATKYHTVRGRMFENTHKPRPALRGSSMAEFDAGHYANLHAVEEKRVPAVPARNSTLKRSNTVAAPNPTAQQRTLDRRELLLHQQQHQYHPPQGRKERVRQQKPIDEYSDHLHRPPVSHYPDPMMDLESKLRTSAICDSSGARYRDKSSPADYRRGSDDSESNLSIGDRMTSYRSDNDLCSQIYRKGSRNGSLASIPRATATLSRNRTIKGRPILEDIPADLLPRLEPEKPKRTGKKVGFGKMLYNTISAGTKFPRTLLKSHFGAAREGDTSECDSATGYQDSGPLSSLSSASSSGSTSPPSSSKSSSFKKLFGGASGGGSRSTSNSSTASNSTGSGTVHPSRRPQAGEDCNESYIITSARHGPVGSKFPSLVPVHTYARKRRTGNLIANEPIYGNVEEIYANPD